VFGTLASARARVVAVGVVVLDGTASGGMASPGATIQAMVWPTGDDGAFVYFYPDENTVSRSFDLHHRFIGLDFK